MRKNADGAQERRGEGGRKIEKRKRKSMREGGREGEKGGREGRKGRRGKGEAGG